MADAKKEVVLNLSKKLLFIFLVLYPFGVIVALNIKFSAFAVSLHPLDLVAGIFAIFFLLGFFEIPKVYNHILFFVLSGVLSSLISLSFLPLTEVLLGSLYLIRFFSYSTVFIVVVNLIRTKRLSRVLIFDSLILVSVVVAAFGWIQYFWQPDLRFLKFLGWDDHLSRLTGTFLDPTFMGAILVLGFVAVLTRLLGEKGDRYKLILAIIILAVTVAFTYSRSSYLALVVGAIFTLLTHRKRIFTKIAFGISVFLLLILFLPRPSSEGVKLERTFSIFAKVQNYKETFNIFATSPLLGIGFNNICSLRLRLFGDNFASHSCYGSDSSLLLILATTGVIGFLLFINLLMQIYRNLNEGIYASVLISSFLAILVHSLFANSLFYPWIMAWLFILLGVAYGGSFRVRK